jgi:hypothetical protein
MEKFYLLRTESDPKVIGVKNGITQANIDRSGYSQPEKYDDMIRVLGSNQYSEYKNKILDMDFEIQCARCLPEAKLTDFLLFGPFLHHCPFLVSERLYTTLSNFKFPVHKFFKAKVTWAEKTYKYHMLYMPPSINNFIDYSRSTFRSSFDVNDESAYNFSSECDFLDFAKNNIGTTGKDIFLNKNFCDNLDLFYLNYIGFIISERLKNVLESSGITSGSKILPAYGDVPWLTVTR